MSSHAYTVMRMVFAAAMAFAAATGQPLLAWHDTGGTTEQFYTVTIAEGRVGSIDRGQVETALRRELAAANVKVSQGELAGAVDDAMKQLADWTGKTALHGCSPSGGLCYVIRCAGC